MVRGRYRKGVGKDDKRKKLREKVKQVKRKNCSLSGDEKRKI